MYFYILYVLKLFGCNVFSGPMSAGGSFNRSSTLPHRIERSSSATREGYYSDRQDAAARERDRERGYLSDHALSR